MGTINTSMQAVQKAQIDLGEVDNLPPLGQDMVLYSAHTRASVNDKTLTQHTVRNMQIYKDKFSLHVFLSSCAVRRLIAKQMGDICCCLCT